MLNKIIKERVHEKIKANQQTHFCSFYDHHVFTDTLALPFTLFLSLKSSDYYSISHSFSICFLITRIFPQIQTNNLIQQWWWWSSFVLLLLLVGFFFFAFAKKTMFQRLLFLLTALLIQSSFHFEISSALKVKRILSKFYNTFFASLSSVPTKQKKQRIIIFVSPYLFFLFCLDACIYKLRYGSPKDLILNKWVSMKDQKLFVVVLILWFWFVGGANMYSKEMWRWITLWNMSS